MEQRKAARRENFLLKMPKEGTCAEIGVWAGDFSRTVLDIVKPARLHLIDPWKYEAGDPYRNAWYGGQLKSGQEEMDAVFSGVQKRFAAEVETGRVVIHRGNSADVVSIFPDHYFDWIYVDANHLYEFVKTDLELWAPTVKPGGYLTGDDYTRGGWWEGGVKRAVDEFAKETGRTPTIMKRKYIFQM